MMKLDMDTGRGIMGRRRRYEGFLQKSGGYSSESRGFFGDVKDKL